MSVFHAYDIRGIYGTELTEELVEQVGLTFPDIINAKKIVVGYDMRTSSLSLYNALLRGLLQKGVEVFTIGLCSAPKLYFATFFYNFPAGIMITASHNPKEYNGIKFVKEKGESL